MEIIVKTGANIAPYLEQLAHLRITVFREYPYLYDGTQEYEKKYLQTYIRSERAMAVLVFDGDTIIGVSTGVPMMDETEEFKAPFLRAGLSPGNIFYCGESVLLSEYRGKGIYKEFFKTREKHAVSITGITHSCFCAVVRPDGHPLTPKNYQPLDKIWEHFGYKARNDLVTHYRWKDIDQAEQTDHPMMYWIKKIK